MLSAKLCELAVENGLLEGRLVVATRQAHALDRKLREARANSVSSAVLLLLLALAMLGVGFLCEHPDVPWAIALAFLLSSGLTWAVA